MSSSIFDWFRSRTRRRLREEREEDVHDTLYQHRNIELFPKDLNKDYNPWDFYDEPVEPKSFRNQITSALAWTVGVPLVLFLVLQQESMKRTTSMLDQREHVILAAVESSAVAALAMLPKTLVTVSQLEVHEYGPALHAERLLQTLQLRHPVQGLLVAHSDGRRDLQGRLSAADPSSLDWRTVEDNLAITLSSEESRSATASDVRTLLFRLSFPDDGVRIYIELDPTVLLSRLWRSYEGFSFFGALYAQDGRLIAAVPQTLPGGFDAEEARKKLLAGTTFWHYGPQLDQIQRAVTTVEPFGWFVVADHPLRDRYEEFNTFIVNSGLLFLAGVLAVFLIGGFTSRSMTRTVSELTDALDAYARTGRLPKASEEVLDRGPAEIAHFAAVLESVVAEEERSKQALRRLNAHLEDLVALRTESLERRNAELSAIGELLAPLGEAFPSVIGKALRRITQLWKLEAIEYVPASSPRISEEEADAVRLPVELDGKRFGWIIASPARALSPEAQAGLERLARAIAVVFLNRRMLLDTVRQHTLLSDLLASMTEGVALLTPDGRITERNDCFARLIGGAPTEGETLHAHLRSRFTISRLRLNGTSSPVEPGVHPWVNGAHYRFESIALKDGAPEKTLAGVVFGILSATDKDQTGEQGILVRDVTHSVELERMKDQLISIVAHELKTPLTALTLQSETLLTQVGLSADEESSILEGMRAECFRLNKLVDDWLDLTKLQNGMAEINCRIVHIATPIDRAAKIVSARSNLAVERRIDPEAECFRFDPALITQVFINLFMNAARYRRPDVQPMVRVIVVKRGDFVEIRVADNGAGIAPEKLPHVFERFFQGDMSVSRASSGMGLGLAIVKGIVEAHGGEVSAESRLGEGTAFTIRLPY